MSLEQALVNGGRIRVFGRDATIECRNIGILKLTSGRIVACDPFLVYDAKPFEDPITPGEYPVRLSIAHWGSDQWCIVAATILFAPRKKPLEWWTATTTEPGSSRCVRQGNVTSVVRLYDMIVDYGCASFMDADTAAFLDQKLKKSPDFVSGLAEMMQANSNSWAMPMLNARRGLNLAIFSSGAGDGGYYSYWGFGRGQEPVCLATDFGVLNEQAV